MVSPAVSLMVAMLVVIAASAAAMKHDYKDALMKSIKFFEGQRSGRLPPNQRIKWRDDSGLRDGFDNHVDLVGGYYDAGDNIKFHFPMAFTTTMLAWSVLEFGDTMYSELPHAIEAIKWSTDYLLKATNTPNVVYVQVGDPWADHNCWERPEDMDTPRTSFAVTKKYPGSEVSAEIAAALASSSIVLRRFLPRYSKLLRARAEEVFKFADTYRGSYNNSKVGPWVCPFYCDYSGYQDELLWGAAWLHKATKKESYLDYVQSNVYKIGRHWNIGEFGWDSKDAGISVLLSEYLFFNKVDWKPFVSQADEFVCSVIPGSSSPSVIYTPGGLIQKPQMNSLQITSSLSFLLVVYAKNLKKANRVVQCEHGAVTPSTLVKLAKSQVDYILGKNPMKTSYMVGYGRRFPRRVHHRGSSSPSIKVHKNFIKCKDGTPYYIRKGYNPNLLTGAVVGGPDEHDWFDDDRNNPGQSEPTTYTNAPLVGLLAYFSEH
ncbi:Endoglucanase [Heracleum sosnowskyi]|uniref:Endoglucanase n=1 Tax=Heracleum sosnowskyi TaxID=360622 RepID=A0AAD8HFT9_9APIA|nr:Endoglucanase [Heracleum sosnowskyi]